jgi:phosphoglycolate phosphatase
MRSRRTRSDKGELIAHVLAAEGIPARQAWMIGDREHDIVGARRNRVRAVGVLWGYGSEAELRAADADHLLAAPSELPPLAASRT